MCHIKWFIRTNSVELNYPLKQIVKLNESRKNNVKWNKSLEQMVSNKINLEWISVEVNDSLEQIVPS